MRTLIILSLILCAQFSFSDFGRVIRNCLPSVVTIRTIKYYGAVHSTGFVLDKKGHIVTNGHVVKNATNISVHFESEDLSYKAIIVGADFIGDVAVLKIKPLHKLKPVVFSKRRTTYIGAPVIAIGNALGRGITTTFGYVSGLEIVLGHLTVFPVIRFDMSTSPGQSGSPLINRYGKVIGLVSANGGRYDNVGYAVPIKDVKDSLVEIMGYKNIIPDENIKKNK